MPWSVIVNNDEAVRLVKQRVYDMARAIDLDSAVLIQAIAEITAEVAVQLDDATVSQGLDPYLATFADHVRAHHVKYRNARAFGARGVDR